jgi:hypothetical protein
MSTARRMHRLAPMARKSGRGGRGKQQVVDITPIILAELRDMHRDLSTRMDRIEVRMGGLEARMYGFETDLGGFRDDMGGFRTNVERRLGALESAVFRKH